MEMINVSALRISAVECHCTTSPHFSSPQLSPLHVATVAFRRTSATVLLSAKSSHFLRWDKSKFQWSCITF